MDLTNNRQLLGQRDRVKVGELVADLAPVDAATLHGDGIQTNIGGAAPALLNMIPSWYGYLPRQYLHPH